MIPDIERDLQATEHARKQTPKGTSERTALWNRKKELERQLIEAKQQELSDLRRELPSTCLLCAHCRWDSGSSDYSEYTPGYAWSCKCAKKHFDMDGSGTSEMYYRSSLLRARFCPDYDLSQEAGNIIRESAIGDAHETARQNRILVNAPTIMAFLDDIETACRKHGMILPDIEPADGGFRIVRADAEVLTWFIQRLRCQGFCDGVPL